MIWSQKLFSHLVCLSALVGFAPLRPEQPASTPLTLGSKSWVGRYEEVEEYLKTAECVIMEQIGPSTSALKRCVLRPGGLVARMLWKPMLPGVYRGFKERYKADLAAYELDKLLKMDMVPPAVERELQGYKGGAIQWVERIVEAKDGTPPGPADRTHWEEQLVRMRMFDNLIGNQDRNRANVLRDPAWNLILIDHSRAFVVGTELPHDLSRIDNEFWNRIQRLTRKQLDDKLRPWIDADEITAILKRRDRMKAQIAKLIAHAR